MLSSAHSIGAGLKLGCVCLVISHLAKLEENLVKTLQATFFTPL